MKSILSIFLISIVLVACVGTDKKQQPAKEESEKPIEFSTAESIVAKAIEAHGGTLYDKANYSFEFRGKLFSFWNDDWRYQYTRQFEKDSIVYNDTLTNDRVVRFVNGEQSVLNPKLSRGISNGVNSVVYFATLPYKLKDNAVNKIDRGTTTIKGKEYWMIEVNFNEEGGGEDHQDVYYYWFDSKTYVMEYLAYSYEVNEGGVRFRSAFNPRTIDGIRFQDYVNYKAPVGTALKDLPQLFEKGELEELSIIATENVIRLQ